MSITTTRERMIQCISELPEQATIEDAIERLYFLHKVEQGLRDADAGRTISRDEARQRMDAY